MKTYNFFFGIVESFLLQTLFLTLQSLQLLLNFRINEVGNVVTFPKFGNDIVFPFIGGKVVSLC